MVLVSATWFWATIILSFDGCVMLQVNHYTAVVVGPYISGANVTVDEVKQRESLPQSEFYNNQALLAITTL